MSFLSRIPHAAFRIRHLAFGIVVFALLVAAPLAASQESRTFTGVIGDSMCVRDHAAMKVAPEDKCVRDCVKHSADVKYILLTKDKHYVLSDQAAPEKFAGQKVVVKGVLYEKTGIIKVETIEAAK
jgi:hypothetical protein